MACPSMPGVTVEERALNLLPPVLQYHGDLSVGEMMAIAEHESIKFTKFFGPTVTACGSPGNAIGVWQVMSSCMGKGYNLTPTTACDLWKSTAEVSRVLHKRHAEMIDLAPEAATDPQLHAYLLYVGHHAGSGGMSSLIKSVRSAGLPMTVDSVYAKSSSSYAAGYLDVSQRAAYWQQVFAPALKTYDAPSPWASPLLWSAMLITAATLAAVIYLETSGSRSKWLHWAPASR